MLPCFSGILRHMARILVAEDDPDIASLLELYLQRAGFEAELVSTGRDVLPRIKKAPPDLLLLDLMLPGVDGLEICRGMRGDEQTASIPIIMVTAKGEESDRIVGLELGADDYITKPFSPNEVIARIRALLRRAQRTGPVDGRLSYGPLTVDVDRHLVFVDGRRREADGEGVRAAAVPDAAPRPGVVPRPAAVRRLGLLVYRRHANRRRARPPPARKSAVSRRRHRDDQAVRLQADRPGADRRRPASLAGRREALNGLLRIEAYCRGTRLRSVSLFRMGSSYRLTIFASIFGGAALALLLVTVTTSDPLSEEHRTQLLTIVGLGLGSAVVAAFLVSSVLAAPLERRVADIKAVARRYAVGDLGRPLPDYGDDELGEVARAMDGAVQELGRRVDELSRDRTRMVAILSSMVEGVLVVDDQGRLQHVNDAARRMLRLDHDALNHSYVDAIRHPGIADQISRVLAGEQPEGLELSRDARHQPHARRPRRAGGGRRPGRGARAPRHH